MHKRLAAVEDWQRRDKHEPNILNAGLIHGILRPDDRRGNHVTDVLRDIAGEALEGHADTGTEELAKALLIDPTNTMVAERMREMKAMNDQPPAKLDMKVEGLPELKPRSGRQNLDLRGDTKTTYEQVGNSFGIKMTFDPELQTKNVRLHLDDVDNYQKRLYFWQNVPRRAKYTEIWNEVKAAQ